MLLSRSVGPKIECQVANGICRQQWGINSTAIVSRQLRPWSSEEHRMPALAGHELVQHSFVVRIVHEQVIDINSISENSTETIAASLAMVHSSRIPLDIKMYYLIADRM